MLSKRKASPQPLDKLLGVKMPTVEPQALLSVLNNLPSFRCWAHYETANRRLHHIEVKQGYIFLKNGLRRYFGKQSYLASQLADFEAKF